MFKIKIKGKRLKIFNLLILIFIVFTFMFYAITFFSLLFSDKYEDSFIVKKENYELENNVTFTNYFKSCVIKENYKISVDDEMIKKALYNNLQEDGFKVLDNTLVRLTKQNKTCDKVINDYKKTHSNNYASFKLNGKSTINLNDGGKYEDEYVTLVINNKQSDNVKINSNLNNNRIGTYLITYKAAVSDDYNEYLYRKINVKKDMIKKVNKEPVIEVKDGLTYVDGILIVNKKYPLPKDYDPKVNKEALEALKSMQADAKTLNLDLTLISGYRSYKDQEILHEKYVLKDGEEIANTYSAKPGYSEHQTGLAFDVGSTDRSFSDTIEAKWIEENAHLYGFIVRYPKDKMNITGYIYEPWHIRYLGVDIATKVKESGLTLEEYLGIN